MYLTSIVSFNKLYQNNISMDCINMCSDICIYIYTHTHADIWSQLDKPRLFLAATDTVHVNIFCIDNCKCVLHMCVSMYFVGNEVTITTTTDINEVPDLYTYVYIFICQTSKLYGSIQCEILEYSSGWWTMINIYTNVCQNHGTNP